MCGVAYETYADQELYFRYLGRPSYAEFSFQPVYNLCPTMNSPALRLIDGERRFDSMHWQLIPSTEGAEIPFDNVLDRITGSDPSVADYILEALAGCPNCHRDILEKTLV